MPAFRDVLTAMATVYGETSAATSTAQASAARRGDPGARASPGRRRSRSRADCWAQAVFELARSSTRVTAASAVRRSSRPPRRSSSCCATHARTSPSRRSTMVTQDARRDGRGRHLRPARRRLPPLLRRRALARAALREDALRQRAARARLPRRAGRSPGEAALSRGRRGDARLPAARDAAAGGRVRFGAGRRHATARKGSPTCGRSTRSTPSSTRTRRMS